MRSSTVICVKPGVVFNVVGENDPAIAAVAEVQQLNYSS